MKTSKGTVGPLSIGLLALTLMLLLAFWSRQPNSEGAVGVQNIEATYHALLTIKALEENPARRHFYLPIVTLGNDADKGIPWGATIPTAGGDYIYTSFTPPGFLAPYSALRLFNTSPTVGNLARFNFALGAVTSIILFVLLWRMLNFVGHGQWTATGGALTGSAIGVFSKEVLQSHGLVYWSHCLYQVALVAGLWLVFKYLSTPGGQSRERDRYSHAIVCVAALGAWTEWTGYVFNFGLASLLWFGARGVGRERGLSVRIFLATTAVGVATVAHYSLATGLIPTMHAFTDRFLARNTLSGNPVQLIQGYGLSFGLFLFVLGGILIANNFSNEGRRGSLDNHKVIEFVIIAASVPLLENILMMQHAGQFSFDRLKFIFPAAIFVAVYFCGTSPGSRLALIAAIVLASFHGYKSYEVDLHQYEKWKEIDAGNLHLAAAVSRKVDAKCAVFLSSVQVRGYAPLLFGRGIYGNRTLDESVVLMRERNACAAVFLDGEGKDTDFPRDMTSVVAYTDLPSYKKAVVSYPDGATLVVDTEEYFRDKQGVNPSFFISDNNWHLGVALGWAGFFVPNSKRWTDAYKAGNYVKLGDGEVRRIVRTAPLGQYLNVFLEGQPLDARKVGLPSSYQIIDQKRDDDKAEAATRQTRPPKSP